MKKSVKSIAAFMLVCFALCSCQSSNEITPPPVSQSEVANPFDNTEPDNSTPQSEISVTVPQKTKSPEEIAAEKNKKELEDAADAVRQLATNFFEEQSEWVDEQTLKLPFHLSGKGKDDTIFCPVVLTDGNLVQTSMDGESFGYSESRIKMIYEDRQESPNTETTHEIYIKPVFDSGLTKHYIFLGFIINPDKRPYETRWMASWWLVQGSPVGIGEIDIRGHESLCREEKGRLAGSEPEPLTDSLQNKYGISMSPEANPVTYMTIEEPEGKKVFIECEENHKHDGNIMLKNTDKALLNVVVGSNQPVNYLCRVTFYVNNKQVKINGDKDFLDVQVEGGKISRTEVELSGLKDMDIVYLIFTPLPQGERTYRENFRMTYVLLAEDWE